jgi:hypothetical protein
MNKNASFSEYFFKNFLIFNSIGLFDFVKNFGEFFPILLRRNDIENKIERIICVQQSVQQQLTKVRVALRAFEQKKRHAQRT